MKMNNIKTSMAGFRWLSPRAVGIAATAAASLVTVACNKQHQDAESPPQTEPTVETGPEDESGWGQEQPAPGATQPEDGAGSYPPEPDPGGQPPPPSDPPADPSQPPSGASPMGAPAPEPAPPQPGPPTGMAPPDAAEHQGHSDAVDGDTIDSFARAYVKVVRLQPRIEQSLSRAETAEQAQRVREKASAELSRAVRTEGLTVEEFQRISQRTAEDDRLRAQVESSIRENTAPSHGAPR